MFVDLSGLLRNRKRPLDVVLAEEEAAHATPPPAAESPVSEDPPPYSREELERIRAENLTEAVKLAREHPHPRDDRVWMHEEPHLYYVDWQRGQYVSVTTFKKKLFKEFNPEMAAGMVLRSRRYQNKDPTYEYTGMSKETILKKWKDNGELQSGLGTQMHKQIELFWNDQFDLYSLEALAVPELEMFRAFVADYPSLRPYRTEWMVFHEELALCGSIDMVFRDTDGQFWIYDWKRCKKIEQPVPSASPGTVPCTAMLKSVNVHEYTLQLNLYKYILETKYDMPIRGMCLLFLHPRQKTYVRIEVEDWSNSHVPAILDYRRAML
jgi:ATP-dependent exoDNAse (exonuclease V) beta subunit